MTRLSLMPLFLLTMVGLGATAQAQVFRTDALVLPQPILVEAPANADVVQLLTGLAKIESDLQLGLLFLTDGLTNPEGSHFSHPRAETLPGIKPALLAAGVADFEPLLVALEAGGDTEAVMTAYQEAIGALMMARSVLRPSVQDRLQSIVEQTRQVAAKINPSGPTELANYQDAWAMLMVARNEIDLLSRDKDPAVAKAAQSMGITFDFIILDMPDPSATGPVTYDPTPINAAIQTLEDLVGSV